MKTIILPPFMDNQEVWITFAGSQSILAELKMSSFYSEFYIFGHYTILCTGEVCK